MVVCCKFEISNVTSFTDPEQISYGLEYSTALFMNLCLHRSGKEKCLPMARPVLQALERLLDANAVQILPYLYGALFSLVGHVQGLVKKITLNSIRLKITSGF